MPSEAPPDPEIEASASRETTPSFTAVFFAPWLAIFRPTAAARTLVAASRPAFWATFIPLCIACAAALAFVPIVVKMFDSPRRGWGFVAIWRSLNRGSWVGPVELCFVVGLFALPALVAASSWLMLTRTLRSESVLVAAGRMFRAQFSVALFGLFLAAFYIVFLITTRVDYWLSQFISIYLPLEPLSVVTGLLLCVWLVSRIESAANAIGNDGVAPPQPPCCESCGYDLSHSAADGRCTECGESVERSLTPAARRPGCNWENDAPRSAGSWRRTSLAVLLSPRRFYESLAVQTDLAAARRFALMQLRYIALGAAGWVAIAITAERYMRRRWSTGTLDLAAPHSLIALAFLLALAIGTPLGRYAPWRLRASAWFLPAVILVAVAPSPDISPFGRTEAFWIAALLLFAAPLVCWLGHRLGAALISVITIYNRFLPDFRRAEKVILYESVFLWLYCAGWGVLVTSFILFDDWMTRWSYFSWLRRVFGIPVEFVSLYAVTIALSILWARRYLIAFRAVRWANF